MCLLLARKSIPGLNAAFVNVDTKDGFEIITIYVSLPSDEIHETCKHGKLNGFFSLKIFLMRNIFNEDYKN